MAKKNMQANLAMEAIQANMAMEAVEAVQPEAVEAEAVEAEAVEAVEAVEAEAVEAVEAEAVEAVEAVEAIEAEAVEAVQPEAVEAEAEAIQASIAALEARLRAAKKKLKEAKEAAKKKAPRREFDVLADLIAEMGLQPAGFSKHELHIRYLEALGLDPKDLYSDEASRKLASISAQLGARIMPKLQSRGISGIESRWIIGKTRKEKRYFCIPA